MEAQAIAIIQEYINNGCKYFSIYSTKLKNLIQSGLDINFFDCYSNNMLHIACYKGDPQIIEFLVKNGANPDILDPWGNTPLFACILDGKYEHAKVLLDNGANINYVDSRGNTPLDYCFIYNPQLNNDLANYIKSLGGINKNVKSMDTNLNEESSI
jgi:ankyrin repeat protein